MNRYLDVSPGVAAALSAGRPVVALESTIISHGMPYPRNRETALKVESILRDSGVEPATVAVINGRLKAGLSGDEIEFLAREGRAVAKASRRDLPGLVAAGKTGATTVASTMIIAALAGIRIFATGGIGGVHRGAETSWDISADLDELARTDVAVICAGAKAILDLPKTLEYLETKGVPVIGYRTDELPAFYTSRSGLYLAERADSAAEVAGMLGAKWDMGLSGGVIIANPIPAEFSMEAGAINAAIEEALAAATAEGIVGRDVTPFLLGKVKEFTGGESLDSNIELVFNNARLAAEIAIEFCRLSR